MSGKKTRNLLLALLILGILVFVAVSFIGTSILSDKSREMVELKTKSSNIDAQLVNLSRAKKDVEKYKSFNDIAALVIPKDKNQVEAIADIFQIAQETGITLQSVAFPNSTLGTKPTATATPATPSTEQAVTAPTAPQTVISQAKPFPAVPGLYSLELTITPLSDEFMPRDKQVTYAKFINFLSAIENNRRTAQIVQVTIQPISTTTGANDLINFTLTLNIFIKP